MGKELIVNCSDSQVKFALLEDKNLVELHETNGENKFSVGDVYYARIKKLAPGLNASFVDLNYQKDAFLHYHDLGPNIRSMLKLIKLANQGKMHSSLLENFNFEKEIDKNGNIADVLTPGQKLIVQIEKEPISTKGPRISSEISFAGRYLVLVPFSNRISVSSKIEDKKEKERLKRLILSIRPKGFGVIIRTVAKDKKIAELDFDLTFLINRWQNCFKQIERNEKLPSCVSNEMGKSSSILRDMFSNDFTNIICDNEEMTQEIKNYLHSIAPDKTKIARTYTNATPIFEKYHIDKQIKKSFGKTVPMSKGAYLVIEHTEAMHVIDVNSGSSTGSKDSQEQNALAINLLSADEIARQLRLRDMGGIVVIDFIDMRMAQNRIILYEHFRDRMKEDRAKHKILHPSKFGLIQLTRQRVRPEKKIKTREQDPSNPKRGIDPPINLIAKIEMDLEKKIKTPGKIHLHAHPFVVAYLLQGILSIRFRWYLKHKKWVRIFPRNAFTYLHYEFLNKDRKSV